MMRSRLITFVCLLALPTAVMAQYEGSRMSISSVQNMGAKEAWDSLLVFASCYASSQRSKAYRFVATEPGTADEARAYKALFTNSDEPCLGSVTELTVNYQYVRGAIAEGLYFKRVPVPANLAARPIARERVQSILQTAICYASQNPAEARWLIENTEPNSDKEIEAVERLRPRFVGCLPPNMPQSFSISSTLLRFRIAEAMWKLGMVPGQADAPAPAPDPARSAKPGEERGD